MCFGTKCVLFIYLKLSERNFLFFFLEKSSFNFLLSEKKFWNVFGQVRKTQWITLPDLHRSVTIEFCFRTSEIGICRKNNNTVPILVSIFILKTILLNKFDLFTTSCFKNVQFVRSEHREIVFERNSHSTQQLFNLFKRNRNYVIIVIIKINKKRVCSNYLGFNYVCLNLLVFT